jgi:hypothetical protein
VLAWLIICVLINIFIVALFFFWWCWAAQVLKEVKATRRT